MISEITLRRRTSNHVISSPNKYLQPLESRIPNISLEQFLWLLNNTWSPIYNGELRRTYNCYTIEGHPVYCDVYIRCYTVFR